MARKAPLLLVAWATASTAADSPSDDADRARIDTIVVTATRIEQPVAETGSTVRIIDEEDIAALGFSQALDAIAGAPGVTVNQNGSFGGAASVRVRGASSAQTLVLIDGVSVNDASAPGGGFNFARLDTENIERVEILSGPQSTLWGSDAIGGVVSVTTKRPGRRSPRQPVCPSRIVRRCSRRGIGQPRRPCRRLPARGHPAGHRWHVPGRRTKRQHRARRLRGAHLVHPGRPQPCPGRADRRQRAVERRRRGVRQFPFRRPRERGRRR